MDDSGLLRSNVDDPRFGDGGRPNDLDRFAGVETDFDDLVGAWFGHGVDDLLHAIGEALQRLPLELHH